MRHQFRCLTHVWNGREFTAQEPRHYPNGSAATTNILKLIRKTAITRKAPTVVILQERKPNGFWFQAGHTTLGTPNGKVYSIPLEVTDWQSWVVQQLKLA